MSGVTDALVAVAGAVGALAGVVGLAVAIRANELAQNSNGLAQAANDTASDALGKAEEANGIAVDANELAGDANAIAERALRVAQDDVPYSWALKVDDDGTAVVINDCGHPANQVAVIIDSGGDPVADAGPVDVPAFGQLPFDVSGAVEKHFERVRGNPGRKASGGDGVFIAGASGKPVTTVFRAHLSWRTVEQVPRTDVVQEVLRHQMTSGGAIRRADRTK